jgi:ABC-type amino acid transport substrate-binding protein
MKKLIAVFLVCMSGSMMVTNALFFLPDACSQEPIKIGSMENFPPYNFTGKDGKYIGIDVAIIEAVLNKLGIAYTHQPRPWKRAVKELEDGDTQMLFQLSPKTEWFEKFYMAGPLRTNNRAYFVKHGSDIRDIPTIQDLKGRRVGIILGYRWTEEFVKADYFEKQEVAKIEQNVLKLDANRVDVVIENESVFNYLAQQLKLKDRFRMLPTYFETDKRYAAFRRDERGKKLAEMFQKKLDELVANGTIQSIIDTWHE